jgi:hypothetical protein
MLSVSIDALFYWVGIMIDYSAISLQIRRLYELLSGLDTSNISKQKYIYFHQLISNFLNIHNEWEKVYAIMDWNIFQHFIYTINLYIKEQSVSYLESLEELSKNFLQNLADVDTSNIDQEIYKHVTSLKASLYEIDNLQSLKEENAKIKLALLKLKEEISAKYLEIENLNIRTDETTNLVRQLTTVLEQAKEKQGTLNEIIDSTSNSQIKLLYEGIYTEESKIANNYRKWALWIFAAVGLFLVVGFLIVSIQNWNHLRNPSFIEIKLGWDSLFKTLMLFSLTTPAWYLTKESSKHRQVAYKAKMLGTELAAFPLYAREFKDEDRLELRKNLADRFFGQELYGTSNSKADNSAASTEQIKLLAEMNKVTVEAIKVQQTLLGKKE